MITILLFLSFWGAVFSFIAGNTLLGVALGAVFVVLVIIAFSKDQAAKRRIQDFEQSLSAPGPHMVQFVAGQMRARMAYERGDSFEIEAAMASMKSLVAQGLPIEPSDRLNLEIAHALVLLINGKHSQASEALSHMRSWLPARLPSSEYQDADVLVSGISTLSQAERVQVLGVAIGNLSR